ncbi:MAG: tetratricopeptide repeat protein [Bacteroidales bacterium]|nr:tetratricopeptide repeat protein [Bacteroidales bacterium]
MKKLILILLGLAMCLAASAQPDKADVRRGNREFRRGHYPQADIFYRRALLADSTSFAARYNLAGALYRQNNIEEAGRQLETLRPAVADSRYAARYWFNTGDVALAAKDYKKAVDAFRETLILEPDNMEAKENYVYARMMLKNQEQNQDQNQDQKDQNQEQNQDQNQDQQDQNQDQDQQDQDGDGQDRPQPRQSDMTPQQMQQMLKAIQAKEQETQDKVNREKAEALGARQRDKNW